MIYYNILSNVKPKYVIFDLDSMAQFTLVIISLTYLMQSSGPKIEPCGRPTPHVMFPAVDTLSFFLTTCFLPASLSTHMTFSFFVRIVYSTVSEAFWRSINTIQVDLRPYVLIICRLETSTQCQLNEQSEPPTVKRKWDYSILNNYASDCRQFFQGLLIQPVILTPADSFPHNFCFVFCIWVGPLPIWSRPGL